MRRLVTIKLFGGPLDGQTMEVPAGTERIRIGRGVGFWTYALGGSDGPVKLFAKQPTQRKARKFAWWFMGKHGRHPEVERSFTKQRPHVGRRDKSGQAARRRARRAEAPREVVEAAIRLAEKTGIPPGQRP